MAQSHKSLLIGPTVLLHRTQITQLLINPPPQHSNRHNRTKIHLTSQNNALLEIVCILVSIFSYYHLTLPVVGLNLGIQTVQVPNYSVQSSNIPKSRPIEMVSSPISSNDHLGPRDKLRQHPILQLVIQDNQTVKARLRRSIEQV